VKNITVSLPDELYRRARVRAAEQDTSVSAVVQQFLLRYTQQETDYERGKRLQAEVLGSIKRFRASDRLSRDEVHARPPRRAGR
jgi:plasmid stability protein